MTTSVQLYSGETVLVDSEDLDLVLQHRWHRCGWKGQYAGTAWVVNGKQTTKYMHALILGTDASFEVDHINGNKLDNRRVNLRSVTHQQNSQNMPSRRSDTITGIRNVYWLRDEKKYRVILRLGKKNHSFGRFTSIEEAARVASEARRTLMPYSVDRDEVAS